jgi:hypothetical protein
MKTYQIQLVYFDGKDVTLQLTEDQVPAFMEAMKTNKEYWSPDKSSALLISPSQIRYTMIKEIKPQPSSPEEIKTTQPEEHK